MGSDLLISPALREDRLDWTRIIAWTYLPAFLLLHGFVATCLPSRLDPLSTVFIVLAELTAIAVCLGASRLVRSARGFWLLLIAAIVLHSAAMSLDALSEIARAPMLNHVPAISILFSALYFVPLLVAVSWQNDARVLFPARLIHTILSIAIGGLIYLEIFSFLSVNGSPNPADAVRVINLFDAMDAFLAIAGTIRWLGSTQVDERGFFRVLTIFLWIDAISCGLHNRLLIRHDWIWLDLLISAPYAILVPLILTARAPAANPPSSAFVRTVRSASPIFLAGTLAIAGVLETRIHFYFGLAAALFAILGYGTLNTLIHSQGLKTEELLLASKEILEKLVDLDGLTGIANRRAFDAALHREFAAALRTGKPVSLLMIDVDQFKDLNDARGHLTGDEYLVSIAGMLRLTLARATDFVARYGGEEFSAILPATDSAGAMVAAEKVRLAIASLRLSHPKTPLGHITVSIGVSTFSGSAPLAAADLMEAADRALYTAKRAGRNASRFQPIDADARVRRFSVKAT